MAHRFAESLPLAGPASPVSEPTSGPRPANGAPRPISLLIGKSNQLIKMTAALHEALPGVDHVVCADAAKALEKAETVRHFGWAPAIFVFDFRRGYAGDLADSLRKVREGEPNSELVVLIEDRDLELSRTALQVVQAPDKLTFLMTPFWRPDAVATIRALAERYQVACERGAAAESGSRTILGLESELTTMKAKLQIALHAAQHDPLTGILNRTGFVDELTARLARGHHLADRAAGRPRPLQDGQRHARPPRRRRPGAQDLLGDGCGDAGVAACWRGWAATSSASCSRPPASRASTSSATRSCGSAARPGAWPATRCRSAPRSASPARTRAAARSR